MKMKANVYNVERVDLMKEPLFLGSARNTQRYDRNRFSWLAQTALEMQRFFWVPEEIKLNKDKLDFTSLSVAEEWIFTKQLSKLEFLDSYQGRNPMMTFGQLTTNPELEGVLTEQTYFESRLHARSYSYMIENIYSNPDEVFEDIWVNEVLKKQANTVVKDGNDLYFLAINYIYKNQHDTHIPEEELRELKKSIFIAMIGMNILEGIRFYLGFASVWAITEFTGKLPGSSRILQFIQRDEKKHLAFTQWVVNNLKKDPEWKDIWEEIKPEVYDMYFKASEEEFDWADYLYSKGTILGMNAEIGKTYVKFLTNQRLLAIGLKPIYPDVKELNIKWTNKFINLHTTETSLQESEAVDYMTDPIMENDEIGKDLGKYLSKVIHNI
jgi:ribonucleoside-diphosphate reductase beta chain